jgi:hypothetical protein
MSIIAQRVPANPRSKNFDYYPPDGETAAPLSVSQYAPPPTEDLSAAGAVEQIDNVDGANIVIKIENDPEDEHIKAYRDKLKLENSGTGDMVSSLTLDTSDPLKIKVVLGSFPRASASTAGVVKVGSGLSIDANGVLSAAGATYTLPTASASVLGGIKIGSGLSISNGVLSATAGGYALPTASASVLGGVKVGSGLSIDSNGVLSAAGSSGGSGGTNYFSLSGNTLTPTSNAYQLLVYGNQTYSTTAVRLIGNHVDGYNNGAVGNLYLNADVYTATPSIYVRIDNAGRGVYTGSWSQVSDIRKKGNIVPLGDVLESILALDTFYYNPIINGEVKTSIKKIGFSANQVREVYPELVSEDEDGFYSLDYSNITVLLVKAIQELNDRIKGLARG